MSLTEDCKSANQLTVLIVERGQDEKAEALGLVVMGIGSTSGIHQTATMGIRHGDFLWGISSENLHVL